MSEGGDALSHWLRGEGLAALELMTAETPDIIAVVDRDLRVRFINWTAADLTRADVLGCRVLDLAPPAYQDAARVAYTAALAGERTRFEIMYTDGRNVLMWDVRVGPVRVEGVVEGLIAITTNVTEQRRAEADRDRFFSLSLDMLVVASPSGNFKRTNLAFDSNLGYGFEALQGKPLTHFVHPDDCERTKENFAAISRGTPMMDFENRCRRVDGEYRVFSWRAVSDPITGDVYAVARDVTDQRTVEAQLRHAQKMEAVGQLAGGIAHDFNNLMLAILANTELALTEEALSPAVAEYLGDIEGAGRRAADLTKQLLAFSRQRPIQAAVIDLNALTRGLMKMVRRLLPESIAIDFSPAQDLPSIDADPTQIEQVMMNLCVNARDAMRRGGRLRIETQDVLLDTRYCETHPWAKPGRYVMLTVADTGVGMRPEVRERVFEPFFTTKGSLEGTGLGLFMVYGIVRQHGGMIHIDSEPGAGTTFSVYLPAGARASVQTSEMQPDSVPAGGETILLAEDEELVRRAVVQVLQRGGYRVLAASNGLEAIERLRAHSGTVSLALLDMVMPHLGGPETWERMREIRPTLRVLFTSGYADGRYTDRLPDEAELLHKPFKGEDLLRRVRLKLDE